jgi:hypothetical protein
MPLRVVADATTTIAFTSGTNTITRGSGNFTTDTYFVGGTIRITGSTSNNGDYTIATVGTTTITVNEALTTEVASSTETIMPIKGSAYSDDGITWSVGSPTSYLEALNWICVASNSLGRVMAISNTASRDVIAYSDDGVNWTSSRLPYLSTWYSIGYGHGTWIATTTSYTAFSTNNGVTWSIIGSGGYQFNSIKWIPFPIHTGDTLTIDRGATVTCNTDQHAALNSITITDGKLRIENDSQDEAIRFVMSRVSAAAAPVAPSITPSSGLGEIEVEGDWIEIGEGDGSANQQMQVPYTDYVSCLWVETGVGTDEYDIWLNVSGAYGGTLRQYQDGLLDVSTGQRGKFFRQVPSATQDKFITRQATITAGLMTITLDSIEGIYQGAAIIGSGIPGGAIAVPGSGTNTVIEAVYEDTDPYYDPYDPYDEYEPQIKINAQPTLTLSNVPVRIINPFSSQFTNTVVFGDGVNGNKLTAGVRVLCPNIMLTSDIPVNLYGGATINTSGLSFVMTSGGKLSLKTCLMDEAYHNLNQTQSLLIENAGLHVRPTITEVYDLTINHVGMGMPAVRRYLAANIWTARDIRDTQTNSLLMNYITGAVINDLVMVLQSPHAVTDAALTAPTGMLNLSYSDAMSVTNVRCYSLNTVRRYQSGLAFPSSVTNSVFDNIEMYGLPMISTQYSSNNIFTNLINSESMFSYSHYYVAGTRVTYDPSTELDLVDGTKYYFKSRTFFTRDRTEYAESRVYGITPFKGSTYYPDYVTAYCNAPQSVTFGWTHSQPMYTKDTAPAVNANAKNFIEIYRDTTPGFTPALSKKVAGLNPGITISCPTIVTYATPARTLAFTNIAVSPTTEGVNFTFTSPNTITRPSGSFITNGFVAGDKIAVTLTSNNNRTYTASIVAADTITVTENTVVDEVDSATAVLTTNKIVASSGSFITDGYAIGDNLRAMGTASCANNKDFTINNVTATVINVAETVTTQSAVSAMVSIVAKYAPTSKARLLAAGGRTLAFTNIAVSPTTEGVNFTFTGSNTITRPSGSFITNGFVAGDKVRISGTTYNNTTTNFLTITTAAALTLTFANDTIVSTDGASATAVLTVNKVIASSGSFLTTETVITGDIMDVSGSANANNNRVFTVAGVTATAINVIETVTTQAAESSGALLNFKNMPLPRDVYVTASPNFQLTFVHAESSASAARIFTFNAFAKTITASGVSPGSFITDGFVVGDKVTVTGTTYNNKVTLTLTAVAATVLTASAATERQYDEVSTTAVLKANHITRSSTGTIPIPTTASSWALDGFIVGDTITVTGTTSGTNDGTFTVNGLATSYLSLADTITTVSAYTSGVVIRANKQVARQKIYFSSQIAAPYTRTFATASKTITSSAYSFLQDGYVFGDRILINGGSSLTTPASGTINGVYCISPSATANLAATTMLVYEAIVDQAAVSPTPATWTHTGQRPTLGSTVGGITTTAATCRLQWTADSKTLTMLTSTSNTWDTFNVLAGDKIFITGQYYNNGLFTVATHPTAATITVTEPVTVDTTVYDDAPVSVVYVYHPTQKVSVTAAGGRTFTYSQIYRSITASTGSFIFDGYNVGDCVKLASTEGAINDGYYTISSLTATVMQFNEILLVPPTNPSTSNDTISAPNIVNDTDYYYIVRKYDDTGVYNDSEELHIKTTLQGISTNLCLKGTALTTTEWTASNLTVGAATRISPFVNTNATQTVDAMIVSTTTTNGGTLTQGIPTAVDNIYTFSVWVCTQPTILKVATLTAAGGRTLTWATPNTITASSGNFLTDGYEIGDHILVAGCTAARNNGWFTLTNVTETVLTLQETVTNEGPLSATATITNYYNDTLSIAGSISLGTTTKAFTATALWQKVTATFTATALTTNAVITITSKRRGLCIIGATVNLGSTAKPYLATTTLPVSNANEVRDINLVRAWCRGAGDAEMHSGIAIELAAAVTGELSTEVYCGTTADFVPAYRNKVFDVFAGTSYTIVFNNISQNNVIDKFDQIGIAGPGNHGLVYVAASSSGNEIKNLTYDFGGTFLLATAGIASFNTQSNDTYFYNWNLKNYRNYTSLPLATTPIFGGAAAGGSNATSGLTVENMIFNNSDFPIQCLFLDSILKGVSGGNIKPLSGALYYALPIAPVYYLGSTTTNLDSIGTSAPTAYTTVYDTIFNELYFTETTGALSLVFNASAKETKPYTITGNASFSNQGRLFFKTAEDSIEYTWPHAILGVSGFRNLPLYFSGVDLGNTVSRLEGLLVEYKIDTGNGYSTNWTTANGTNLVAESVSATAGFYLKIKITAKFGMKYAAKVKSFVLNETIRGLSSLATARVDAIFDIPYQGTLWLSNVSGAFAPGEVLVRDSDGEMRATNVATATVFATFPAPTSYIDGLQIYTTVDQTAIYPPEQQTLSLTGIKENSEVRIYHSGTTTELAGIENSTTTFDYEYVYSAGTYVDIVILHLDWDYYRIDNYLLPSTGATLPIAQITDRVYSNP